ncbi:MAG: tRNA-dihydrouridine synthase [Candidatus Shapirobacteria bacterium]|nr:tRNA-dihydrouridine synthase [Candidatus Shapirobacteria bacterium]
MDLKQLISSQPIIGLSPLDGITDEAFRLTQCHFAKPDIIFTEFVSAEGLAHNAVKLYDHLLFLPEERPVIGQLFGKDPDSFYLAATILCHLGFDGIDINMGCPARTVTQHGSGAALIEKPELASEIIKAVQQAVKNKTKLKDLKLKQKTIDKVETFRGTSLQNNNPTISVKTRLGINESVIETWIPFLLKHNLDFLTLHGRTLKQGYSGVADWSEIQTAANIAKTFNTPILGNGDIKSRQQGIEYCHKYGVNGVLIGRAAMGNPWVFSDHIATYAEKFAAMKFHTQKFIDLFSGRRFEPLRRHFLLYTLGHPRAKELRLKICQLTSIDQLLAIEANFLNC